MISDSVIKAEVKKVFGDKVHVVTHCEINRDGLNIRIYPEGDKDDIICLETWMDGLEELQNSGQELLDLLRAKLKNHETNDRLKAGK